MSDLKKLLALIAAITAARCASAVQVPLLSSEAYYWLWGRRLAAGYYDHPPMVAVMSRLFFGWVDGSQLAARSGPIILGALSALALYALARELFPQPGAAWRIAALFCLAPIFDAGAIAIQPDNSLGLFTILTWLLFWRAAKRGAGLGPWAAVGVAAGLSLLSKFHAWALLPPLYGFLLFSRERRRLLATPGPWMAVAIALLVLSPNLVWNAHHDWINYAYQMHRSGLGAAKFKASNVAALALGSALTLSPPLFAAIVWGTWRAIRICRATGDPALHFLLFAGVPLPLFLWILSTRVSIALHWPTAGYIALSMLACGLIERGEIFGRRYRRAMWATAAAMTALMHLAPFAVRALPDNWSYSGDPDEVNTARLKKAFVGWREIGEKARQMREEMSQKAPALIMSVDEHLTSSLAFYSRRPLDCFALTRGGEHAYRIWRIERGNITGADAVVVLSAGDPNDRFASVEEKYASPLEFLRGIFNSAEAAPSLVCYADGAVEDYFGPGDARRRTREFLLFRCRGFKGKVAKNYTRDRDSSDEN